MPDSPESPGWPPLPPPPPTRTRVPYETLTHGKAKPVRIGDVMEQFGGRTHVVVDRLSDVASAGKSVSAYPREALLLRSAGALLLRLNDGLFDDSYYVEYATEERAPPDADKLERQVASGDLDAHVHLALLHDFADRRPHDPERATALLRSAAERGNLSARYLLLSREQPAADDADAVARRRAEIAALAQRGHPVAMLWLAHDAYPRRDHAKPEPPESLFWKEHARWELTLGVDWEPALEARLARTRASPRSGSRARQLQYGLGWIALKGGKRDVRQGLLAIENAAALGSMEARLALFRIVDAGVLLRHDPARALRLLEAVARQNHPEGLYLLGQRVLADDPARAYASWETAASVGHVESQAALGIAHEEQTHPRPNPMTGHRLLERAAAAGHVEARFRLGRQLQAGSPGARDLERAWALHLQAAQAGHVGAMRHAAELALAGQVRGATDEAARHWLETAAEKGDRQAAFLWAELRERGTHGATVDLRAAHRWYGMATLKDALPPERVAEAMYRRGLLRMRQGSGRLANDEAYASMRGAAERGHAGAVAALQRLVPPIPYDSERDGRGYLRWLVHEIERADESQSWLALIEPHREALAQARVFFEEIRDRAPTWSPWPELHPGESENLYALSRLNDLTLERLQPAPQERPRADDPRLPTAAQYETFWRALGFAVARPTAFHPFHCEVVEVVAGERDEVEVLDVLWPALNLGGMMFSRAGVRIRAPASRYLPGIASTTLYWSWRRRGRATTDMSDGWGHNSQWRTDFRRDFELADRYAYNVDVRDEGIDLASVPEDADAGGLSRAQQIDLLRHRALTLPLLAQDGGLYPFRDWFDEMKPR